VQVALKESWYEKLQRWNDARDAYERKQREDRDNLELTLGRAFPACPLWGACVRAPRNIDPICAGRMRCQHALADWEGLCELAREEWSSNRMQAADARAEVARLAAAAAWNLRQWEEMAFYSEFMRKDTVETDFLCAVLSVHSNHFEAAQARIDAARRRLDSELTALVGESYHRAYRAIIQARLQRGTPLMHTRPRPRARGHRRCSSWRSSRRSFCTRRSRQRCR